jgi:hypothetical protein
MLGDPATWRDLGWLLVDMTFGFATALLPAVLLCHPLEGFAPAAGLWRPFAEGDKATYWYRFVPVSGQGGALLAGVPAAVLAAAAYVLVPLLLRVHFLLTRSVLAAGQEELAERVRVLTETRRNAVDGASWRCSPTSTAAAESARPAAESCARVGRWTRTGKTGWPPPGRASTTARKTTRPDSGR